MPRGAAIPALFLLLGLAAFVWLVVAFGAGEILSLAAAGGWGLAAAVLLWLAIYGLNAVSWRLALGRDAGGLGPAGLFLVTVSGFALNYITPLVALGGEPYRVSALAPALGARTALPAVVLFRIVHLLGHMIFLLGGIVVTLAAVPTPPGIAAALAGAGAVIAALILLALGGSRGGVFDRIGRLAGRIRRPAAVARAIEGSRGELAAMDEVLTRAYRDRPRAFALSVGLEVLGRFLMGVEVFVLLRSLGQGIALHEALSVYVLYSIVINVLFFIPMNVGAREGGILLGMEGLAPDPVTGMTVGVLIRVREFAWIALGLVFIPLSTRLNRRREHAETPGTG